MRDWPEPDQDTSLEILETWDLGDYEEARIERIEAEHCEEQAKADAEKQAELDAYWDQYAETYTAKSEAEGLEEIPQWAIIEGEQYAEHQKILEKLWKEARIAKLHANIAHARADIVHAEANIARIQADIAAAKSEITNANLVLADECTKEDYYMACNELADAEINLVKAETSLVEAEVVLAKTRSIGVVYADVTRAKTDVKYAEAKVQNKKNAKNTAMEIRETSEREYLVEESNLLAEGAHVEYILLPEQQNDPIEIGFCCEWIHIEYVNALIDLAEAQDALDLAEILLTKTPTPSLIHGYGFASHEPHCPTSYIAE